MAPSPQHQHVLVMRHGERVNNGDDKSWWITDPKPWDDPLTSAGQIEALETGKKLLAQLEFQIDRVVVSPFQRCVQTAQQLITVLPAVDVGDGNSACPSRSRIKVSIEYGMCEVMNDVAMWYHPTDHNSWGFDLKKLEASFSVDIAEITPDGMFKELPQWGESESKARDRYLHTIHSFVDKYPKENILFVTHGEGVKVTASTYWKEARGHRIKPNNLGYVYLKRQIIRNGDSFTASKFEIARNPNETGLKLSDQQKKRKRSASPCDGHELGVCK